MEYHFLSRAEFDRRVAAGEFLEWAVYGGQLYGTLRAEVEKGLKLGRHVVLDIEVMGARQVRERVPDSVHVFVLPPSTAELVQRLRGRRTEDAAAVDGRLILAAEELGVAAEYDYVVVNDELMQAVAQVGAILDAESTRVSRLTNLSNVVSQLRQDLAGHRERLRQELGGRKE